MIRFGILWVDCQEETEMIHACFSGKKAYLDPNNFQSPSALPAQNQHDKHNTEANAHGADLLMSLPHPMYAVNKDSVYSSAEELWKWLGI